MTSLESKCGLWTKTENLVSIQTPEIGANGNTTAGITYAAAKFGNGSKSPSGNGQYITYPRTSIDFHPNKWMTEFWADTDTWTITDGVPSDSAVHRWWDWYSSNNNRVTIQIFTDNLTVAFVVGGVLNYVEFTTDVTFDSTLNHLLFGFDRTGIDGGADTLRIYIEGVESVSSSLSVPDQPTGGGSCHFHNIFFNDIGNYQNFNGTLDNIKMYSDISEALITAALNNRNNEAWPAAATKPRIRVN